MRMLDWIAVDWGTTHCRAWAVGPGGRILAEAASDDGMGGLAPDAYEPALLRLVESWLDARTVDVFACGMVGARQGWIEAPYRAVPCSPLGLPLVEAPTNDSRLRVRILPGLKQAFPADVMRGEETQIGGALALVPGFDGVILLPGTHSKWVHVSAGEIVSFRSYMTGEMFGLLADRSVLRHSVGSGWDTAAFLESVEETLSRPESLAAKLFAIRADGLFQGLSPATARARLSGFLIGAELAGAKAYWLGTPVALVGAKGLADAYAAALGAQGLECRRLDVNDATRAGLAAARALQEAAT